MHTIDLLNLAYSKLQNSGVELRLVHGDGLSSGLCRIANQQVLFINDMLTAIEQLEIVVEAFQAVDIDIASLPKPLRAIVQNHLHEEVVA
jgi:hypothetical protein